jgi:hypothetical protein
MLWLLACDVDWVDRGPRDPPETVTWAGWVYAGPAEGDEPAVLSDATLTFSPEGDDAVEAEQVYDDYPGYWVVEVPAGVPVTLRMEGDELYPTLWAGDTPSGDGSWGNGYLFSADVAYMDELWALLPADAGAEAPGEETVALWGLAGDTDWDCATVSVGGEPAYCVTVGSDGSLTRVDAGPFDWYFAFGLPAGDLLVDSGAGPTETYTTLGGEVVMAMWYAEDS